jgi:signal transduction histidine kinase
LDTRGKLEEMSSRLKWYVALVCATALFTLASLAVSIDASRLSGAWPIITIFGILLALGEIFPIPIRHRNQTKLITVTSTFALAIVPVAGTAITVLVYVASSVLAELIYRKPVVKIAFNASQYVLALTAASAVYTAAGGTFGIASGVTSRELPAFLAGAVVFALVNHLLVATVVALAAGTSVRTSIVSDLPVEFMSSALLITLAPVAVLVAEHSLYLVIALVSPLAAVYLVSKGWADAEMATERQRRLTEQEQEVVRRLQEADRMKADLLATVTHELRSPLTTILGALQLLESRNRKLSHEQRLEFIRMGLRQGERLQRMIEQLLLAARFEHSPAASGDARRVELDASDLVRQAAEEAQTRHHERPIMVDANGALPVRAAQDAVSQVLANLIDNACKYSPQGHPVYLSGARSNGHAVLAVEDSGPGVAPDDRERIFQQFTQLDGSSDDRAGGVGLGLYIARELARSQGGDLLVTDPTSTGGARFELRLPLHHGSRLSS